VAVGLGFVPVAGLPLTNTKNHCLPCLNKVDYLAATAAMVATFNQI
jgi:hypothetical protein